jgi:hypothetical protein
MKSTGLCLYDAKKIKLKKVYMCWTSKSLRKCAKPMSFGSISGVTDCIVHVSLIFYIIETVVSNSQANGWAQTTANSVTTIAKSMCWANNCWLSDVLQQPSCNPLIVHIIRKILLTLKFWKPYWRQSIGSDPGISEESGQQVLCRATQMMGTGPWRLPYISRTAACIPHQQCGS